MCVYGVVELKPAWPPSGPRPSFNVGIELLTPYFMWPLEGRRRAGTLANQRVENNTI
jgi:hypothetical protein